MGVDPNDWVLIDEETLLDGVFGMKERYFVSYVIKQKGSTALVDENSTIIEAIPAEFSLIELKKELLRVHEVDFNLYYCHIERVQPL